MQIRDAEGDVYNQIGKDYNPPISGSPRERANWSMYCRTVRLKAASMVLGQRKAREALVTGYRIEGAYEIDVRAIASNMKAVKLEMDREVKFLIERLKKTDSPQFRAAIFERIL